ncbi:mycofactocin-coupled SDR family oxidoreductase [Pseudonocardia sp. CA-107938]|uniref:mycofactocin-coupled SDR family oxidoreductase n=1 Tax=Pseudonocardia sp. CA-107938 TaxID=3240021 RepID=UPI003D8AD3D0
MATPGEQALEGKVAFISGAARGQGRSHAVRLARAGARIIGFDLVRQIDTVPFAMSTPDDLAESARRVKEAGSEMVAVEGDVRDQEEVDAALRAGLDRFGRVDIVLGNAGILHDYKRTWLLDEDEFRNVIDVNVVGVWHTVKAAVPIMIEQGDGGSIVLTGSAASVSGITNLGGYVASKHAVLGIVRTLAKELGRHQIRVNAIMPGNCNTPMFDNEGIRKLYVPGDPEPSDEEFFKRAAAMTPMRNPYVEPGDVSEAIAWLVSPAGRYVTGVALPVDGGTVVP